MKKVIKIKIPGQPSNKLNLETETFFYDLLFNPTRQIQF